MPNDFHLSPSDRDEIVDRYSLLASHNMAPRERMDVFMNVIEKHMKGKQSFSEIIMDNNTVEKRCAVCGHLHVYYKKRLRKTWVKPLKILAESDTPLQTNELGAFVNKGGMERTQSTVAHLPEARFFGLVDGDGKKRHTKWHITEKGRQFVRGEISVPSFVWTYNNNGIVEIVEMPEDAEKPTPVFIQDIEWFDANDAAMHVEEAEAAG